MLDTNAPPVARPLAAIDEDIPCPLCNYNLRGLTEPRCPECGYRFTWNELTDPALRLHPFLFEYHPESNTRSLVRTAVAGLRPGRFWSAINAAQRPRTGRLFLYWAIYSFVYAVPLSADIAWSVWNWGQSLSARRAWEIANWKNPKLVSRDYSERILNEYGSFQAYLDSQYPNKPLGILRTYLRWCGLLVAAQLIPLVLPWLIAMALSVYQASMLRRGILPQHVIRCVVYSCDALLWITPLTALIWTIERLIPLPQSRSV